MDRKPHSARSYSFNRRRALQLGATGIGLAALSSRSVAAQSNATPVASDDIPVSGENVAELDDFSTLMTQVMSRWQLPGGQLAIAAEGRLVYNRGFGYASIEDQEEVQPHSLFRIASNTKPITAVAILKLVDAGELTLDTPVFPLLALDPPEGAPRDPRLDTITIEQLLVHSGGWNSTVSGDPQYLPWTLLASRLLEAEDPAEAETIIRFMLGQTLDFDPGTVSAYSNFGFNVLGRVIEHISGQPYEQFVIDEVLAPAGITTMVIGGTTLEERKVDEVRYYAPPGMAPRVSVYPNGGYVPVAYGAFYMQALDAHGGWIGTAEDLVRFSLAVDGARGEALLSPETVTVMETTPRPPSAAAGAGNVDEALGLGWNSLPVDGGYEWSHAGALEGSTGSWVVRKPGGTALAFSFNSLPQDYPSFFGDIIPAVQQLLATTTEWPETDQFE